MLSDSWDPIDGILYHCIRHIGGRLTFIEIFQIAQEFVVRRERVFFPTLPGGLPRARYISP